MHLCEDLAKRWEKEGSWLRPGDPGGNPLSCRYCHWHAADTTREHGIWRLHRECRGSDQPVSRGDEEASGSPCGSCVRSVPSGVHPPHQSFPLLDIPDLVDEHHPDTRVQLPEHQHEGLESRREPMSHSSSGSRTGNHPDSHRTVGGASTSRTARPRRSRRSVVIQGSGPGQPPFGTPGSLFWNALPGRRSLLPAGSR